MPERDEGVDALIERIVARARIGDPDARDDLRRELRAHFEDAGRSPGAVDEAVRRFGDESAVAASLRRVHSRGYASGIAKALSELRQDLRFGVRMLARSPGFSVLAILCLTLGIGANAAVFSWIEGLLLRPFPLVADQGRIFAIVGTNRGQAGFTDMSWPDFLDLRRNSRVVEDFIAEKITGTTLNVGDRAERMPGSVVSANYFDAIGVRPLLGRGFEPGEDVGRNAHPVVVISHQMWQERFGGAADVIGKTQMLNGLPHTIVGVMPEGFYGTFVGYAFQFWVPASMQPQFSAGVYKLEDRGARWIEGFVRLRPGVTIDQAQAELSGIAARLERDYPGTDRGRGVRLYPLWQTPFNNAGAMVPILGVSLVVVIAVLLIACANVGNLLLVRAFARQQEMTIRLSIGAARSRLIRQLLTEGAILAAVAAAGGLLLAHWLRDALLHLTPPRGMPMRLPGALDWRVVALSAGVCVLSTLLFGLVPALLASKVNLADALRSQSGSLVGARGRARLRSGLVILQVALSFVLLAGAGLLIQSLQAIRHADPGFSTDNVLTTNIDLFTAGYDASRARAFQDLLLDRLRSEGGVESVALSRMTPFAYGTFSTARIAIDGYEAPPDQQPAAEYNEVSPGYFQTLGIPLLSGRDFLRADDEKSAPVAIVDQTMASQYWRDGDPLGRRLVMNGRSLRVVGVVRASKSRNLLETPLPFFYVPLRQNFSIVPAVYVRTSQTPQGFAPVLAREVHALDPGLAPGELLTMRDVITRTTAPQRIGVTILSVFGGLALLLAAIGLYGLMASTVAQSARELALRMALGADARTLLRLVVSRGLALTAGGIAIGAAAAVGTTRLLGYLLYNVNPRDPVSFGFACAVIVAASLAACAAPAWRATRADPITMLRG
jgi:predicted permease